jgi:uncharacterized protein YndB with AHSA1/START domain
MNDQNSRGVAGSLLPVGDRGTVRMVDIFDCEPAELWSALTDPERLARWVAEVDGDLRVGGLVSAVFTSGWAGTLRVEACDAPRRLLVISDPGPDETVIEALIEPDGPRSRLTIEERGHAAGELAVHGAGWQAHVEDLGHHLAGREPSDWSARWRELAPLYEGMPGAP